MKTPNYLDNYLYRTERMLDGSSWALLAASLTTLGVSLGYPGAMLPGLLGTAGALGVLKAKRRLEEYRIDDDALVEDGWQVRKLREYRGIVTEKDLDSSSIIPEPPMQRVILWPPHELASNPDTYPHVVILGKTGSGKSTLADRLLGLVDGTKIAIAPHWKTGDYRGCQYIVGAGRLYGSEEDEPLSMTEMLSGRHAVSCAQAVFSLVAEMDRRYQLVDGRYRCETDGSPRLEVVLDEYPAWCNIPGINTAVQTLLREARKVGIRLWILAQGGEVKTLGMEGQGSLRDQLSMIRGRGFIQGLPGCMGTPPGSIRLKDLPEPTQAYLESMPYPWLQEESPIAMDGLHPAQPVGQVLLTGPRTAQALYIPGESAQVSIDSPGDPVHTKALGRLIAALKAQGKTEAEIARMMGFIGRNAERGLAIIRELE